MQNVYVERISLLPCLGGIHVVAAVINDDHKAPEQIMTNWLIFEC